MYFHILVLLSCSAALFAAGRSFHSSDLQPGRTRLLLQEDIATGVRVANLSSLPANLSAEVEFSVPERPLKGTINISSADSLQVSYGTYYLGPDQVKQLNETISAEMVGLFNDLHFAYGLVLREHPTTIRFLI